MGYVRCVLQERTSALSGPALASTVPSELLTAPVGPRPAVLVHWARYPRRRATPATPAQSANLERQTLRSAQRARTVSFPTPMLQPAAGAARPAPFHRRSATPATPALLANLASPKLQTACRAPTVSFPTRMHPPAAGAVHPALSRRHNATPATPALPAHLASPMLQPAPLARSALTHPAPTRRHA